MIERERPLLANSLWEATANQVLPRRHLEESLTVDTAIVGAGFAGLSCALHLAERGLKPVVIEARTPGWGASGRNGGQVIPGLKEDPDTIEKLYGPEMGGRMVRISGEAPSLVFDLIRRYGIECDLQDNGWIQAAHDSSALDLLARRAEQWQRRGAKIEQLSKSETARLIGTGAYAGGTLDRRGGSVHPLNYALGLAAAVRSLGVDIYSDSPAESLEKTGQGFLIKTPHGEVRAKQVALCTNGYTDHLWPGLAKTVVPFRSIQVATKPLSENVRRSIFPEGHVSSDTRRLLNYFRLDATGRLLMGGRGGFTDAGLRSRFSVLKHVTHRLFPQIGEVEWEHAWGGLVAMTQDHFPHLNEPAPGLHAALGFNGRGVAMATALGKVLAERLAGKAVEDLEFPVTQPNRIPFYGLRKPAVTSLVVWYGLRDRLGF